MATQGCQLPKRPPRSVSDGNDAAAFAHQGNRAADSDQESLGLGVAGRIPFLKTDLHGRLVEGWRLGAGIADEDIERAKFGPDLLKDSGDFVGATYIGLD